MKENSGKQLNLYVVLAGAVGALLGILAYTHDWLG